MLSFLKQESNTLAALNPSANAGSDQGAENSTDDGFIKPAHRAKNLKQSTMMLVGLFAIGAACLWFMVKKTTPSEAAAAASSQDIEIEKAIAQITGIKNDVGGSGVDDVINRFYHISDVKQVGVDDLKKNPFKHSYSRASGEIPPTAGNSAENEELLRQESIRQKAKNLQLEVISIMKPENQSSCMINDKILYLGDKVNDFTVTKIAASHVEVTQNGVTVLLKLAE